MLEAALVMILLLTLCFGLIEFGSWIYTRHTLDAAAQRAVREATLPDRSYADVADAIADLMAASGFGESDYTLTVTLPGEQDTVQNVTVVLECRWSDVGIRPIGFIGANAVVRGRATMRMEGP